MKTTFKRSLPIVCLKYFLIDIYVETIYYFTLDCAGYNGLVHAGLRSLIGDVRRKRSFFRNAGCLGR